MNHFEDFPQRYFLSLKMMYIIWKLYYQDDIKTITNDDVDPDARIIIFK
jgi:hypothetical protein